METAFELPPPKVKLPEEFMDSATAELMIIVPDEGLSDYKIELP